MNSTWLTKCWKHFLVWLAWELENWKIVVQTYWRIARTLCQLCVLVAWDFLARSLVPTLVDFSNWLLRFLLSGTFNLTPPPLSFPNPGGVYYFIIPHLRMSYDDVIPLFTWKSSKRTPQGLRCHSVSSLRGRCWKCDAEWEILCLQLVRWFDIVFLRTAAQISPIHNYCVNKSWLSASRQYVLIIFPLSITTTVQKTINSFIT